MVWGVIEGQIGGGYFLDFILDLSVIDCTEQPIKVWAVSFAHGCWWPRYETVQELLTMLKTKLNSLHSNPINIGTKITVWSIVFLPFKRSIVILRLGGENSNFSKKNLNFFVCLFCFKKNKGTFWFWSRRYPRFSVLPEVASVTYWNKTKSGFLLQNQYFLWFYLKYDRSWWFCLKKSFFTPNWGISK